MAFVEWLSSLISIVEPVLAKGRCDTEESEAVSLNMRIMCLAAGVGLSVWTSFDWFLGLVLAYSYLSSMAGFGLRTQQVVMEIHQRKRCWPECKIVNCLDQVLSATPGHCMYLLVKSSFFLTLRTLPTSVGQPVLAAACNY